MLPPLYPLQHIHAFGQSSYKNCPDLPTDKPCQVVDTLTAPRQVTTTPSDPLCQGVLIHFENLPTSLKCQSMSYSSISLKTVSLCVPKCTTHHFGASSLSIRRPVDR